MNSFIKKPCAHCPFRNDVKPYLHPNRAEEIAYIAQDERMSFSCHKTTEYNELLDMQVVTDASQECAGMLTLRSQEGYAVPNGFEPTYDLVYCTPEEMIEAYRKEWKKG